MITRTRNRLTQWARALLRWLERNFAGLSGAVCHVSLTGASLVAATWLSEMLWPL